MLVYRVSAHVQENVNVNRSKCTTVSYLNESISPRIAQHIFLVVVVHSSISLQMCTLSYAIALLLKKYEHVVVVGVMKYTKKISMNDMMVMLLSCIFYYYYLLIEEKKKEGKFTNPTTSSYYSYYNYISLIVIILLPASVMGYQ